MVEQVSNRNGPVASLPPVGHPLFAQMEETQLKAERSLDVASRENADAQYPSSLATNRTVTPLNKDESTSSGKELLGLSNEIHQEMKLMEERKEGSSIRRLFALLGRIADLTEKHVQERKERDHEKKQETLEKVDHIANWTCRQGYANFGAGIGYPLLLVLGSLMGEPVLSALIKAKELIPSGARGLENFFESNKKELEFAQSLYLQTASSEKQSLEGFKNMPRELQQKLAQMLREELASIRATGQRG